MSEKDLLRELQALPPEAQRQVADFIGFLQSRYTDARLKEKSVEKSAKQKKPSDIGKEKFIGLWRDREDMQESAGWLRALRAREWAE